MSSVDESLKSVPHRPAQRLVTRAIIDFILRAARAGSACVGDVKQFLLLLAIAEATGECAGTPESAESGSRVSIRAIARSLDLPYETCRRYIAALIDAGLCRKMDTSGIAVCRDARLLIARMRKTIGKLFLRTLLEMSAIGFDFDAGETTQSARSESSAVGHDASGRRAYSAAQTALLQRVACEFFLRCVECGMAPHHRDIDRALIFSAIMAANAESITYDKSLAWQYASASSPPPDDARSPITVSRVSKTMGIPFETARRQINKLVSSGICVRVGRKGVIIPTHIAQAPELLAAGSLLALRFNQAISELRQGRFDFAKMKATDAKAGR